MRNIIEKRAFSPGLVADARLLDFDYLSAQISQKPGAIRSSYKLGTFSTLIPAKAPRVVSISTFRAFTANTSRITAQRALFTRKGSIKAQIALTYLRGLLITSNPGISLNFLSLSLKASPRPLSLLSLKKMNSSGSNLMLVVMVWNG